MALVSNLKFFFERKILKKGWPGIEKTDHDIQQGLKTVKERRSMVLGEAADGSWLMAPVFDSAAILKSLGFTTKDYINADDA